MAEGAVIWVVEDDASTRRLIAEHLKVHGFNAVLFESAEKAYTALQEMTLPALIILDMLLPGMSGVDLIRLIKQNKTWEKIPVVVVTVLSRNQTESTDVDMTQAYWVNKPFDAGHLIQTIQSILASVGSLGREK